MLNAYSPGLGGRARVQRAYSSLGWGCVSRSHGGASHQMPLSGGPSHTLASVKWSGFTSQWNLLGTPCLWPSMIRQAPGAAQFSAAHRDGVGSDGGSSSDGSTVASPICHFCDWLYLQGYQKSFCELAAVKQRSLPLLSMTLICFVLVSHWTCSGLYGAVPAVRG